MFRQAKFYLNKTPKPYHVAPATLTLRNEVIINISEISSLLPPDWITTHDMPLPRVLLANCPPEVLNAILLLTNVAIYESAINHKRNECRLTDLWISY